MVSTRVRLRGLTDGEHTRSTACQSTEGGSRLVGPAEAPVPRGTRCLHTVCPRPCAAEPGAPLVRVQRPLAMGGGGHCMAASVKKENYACVRLDKGVLSVNRRFASAKHTLFWKLCVSPQRNIKKSKRSTLKDPSPQIARADTVDVRNVCFTPAKRTVYKIVCFSLGRNDDLHTARPSSRTMKL